MDAIIHARQRKILDQAVEISSVQYYMIREFREPDVFWIYSNATRTGNEPTCKGLYYAVKACVWSFCLITSSGDNN